MATVFSSMVRRPYPIFFSFSLVDEVKGFSRRGCGLHVTLSQSPNIKRRHAATVECCCKNSIEANNSSKFPFFLPPEIKFLFLLTFLLVMNPRKRSFTKQSICSFSNFPKTSPLHQKKTILNFRNLTTKTSSFSKNLLFIKDKIITFNIGNIVKTYQYINLIKV